MALFTHWSDVLERLVALSSSPTGPTATPVANATTKEAVPRAATRGT